MARVGNGGLELRLFGPFDARLNGEPLAGLAEHRRAAHVLAFLALHGSRVLDREWVADQLSEEDAGGNRIEFTQENLRQQLMAARRMLQEAAPSLVSGHGVLSLAMETCYVDTHAFDKIWDARQTDPRGLERIVQVYQGPLLQDWNEAWLRPQRDAYARKYLKCLQALARQAEEDENMEAAIDYLAMAVETDPISQQAQSRLLKVLLASHEYLKAKQVFEQYHTLLREQGMPLAPEMLLLCDQIPKHEAEAVSSSNVASSVASSNAVSLNAASSNAASSVGAASVDVEPPGGAVPLRSRYYIVRPADTECHTAIARRDSFVLLHGSRQVGKTSVLARGVEQARRMGAQALHTDFQKFSAAEMESLDSFFLSLARRIARTLNLPVSLHDIWDDHLAPGMNFEQFFLESVLEPIPGPVVWGLDEVDRLFTCDYRGDVFSLFRSWHNERALAPGTPLERLTILFCYAVEANCFIPNLNQSPFNVGTSIALNDFSQFQVEELCSLHDLPTEEAVSLFALTCGHPYLTRNALYALKTRQMNWNSIAAQAAREEGPFGSHLRHLRKTLMENEPLYRVVQGVLKGEGCANSEAFYHLTAAGILKGESPEAIEFRCPLYETYLRKRLL